MTSAVPGNRELSLYLVFCPTIPPIIVSSHQGEWLSEAHRQREWVSEAKGGRLPIDPTASNLFVFIIGSPGSLGRVWRTALCMPVYYVIPITQQKPQCSAPHLLIQEGEKYIFTLLHPGMSLSIPTRLKEKWKSSKWNSKRKKKKANQTKWGGQRMAGGMYLEFHHIYKQN